MSKISVTQHSFLNEDSSDEHSSNRNSSKEKFSSLASKKPFKSHKYIASSGPFRIEDLPGNTFIISYDPNDPHAPCIVLSSLGYGSVESLLKLHPLIIHKIFDYEMMKKKLELYQSR